MSEKAVIKVSVTAADIAEGDRVSAFTCPVARALGRTGVWGTTPGVAAGVVWPAGVIRERVHLPLRVQAWITAFDRGEQCEPIEFELEV
jgi:hypothetical protein